MIAEPVQAGFTGLGIELSHGAGKRTGVMDDDHLPATVDLSFGTCLNVG